MQIDLVSLYYREGRSDKFYDAWIASIGDLFAIVVRYGRRGAAGTVLTKASGLTIEQARKKHGALIESKVAEGYTKDKSGTPYAQTDRAHLDSGLRPQLLNAIDESTFTTYAFDSAWGLMPKIDGERCMILATSDGVEGVNRLGLFVALPSKLRDALFARAKLHGPFTLDGEMVGARYYAFDLIHDPSNDIGVASSFERRHAVLAAIVRGEHERANLNESDLLLVTLATSKAEREVLVARVEEAAGEGFVCKLLSAPYRAGRPHTGGVALKYKRYSTATVEVAFINEKQSVGIRVYDGSLAVDIGNVKVPIESDLEVGDFIEVRYLYANPGGALQQPVYLARRSDVIRDDACIGQLSFKGQIVA